ncbi:hypothetical protein [Streptomyces sp. NPDC021020]|uniref:DUF7507 domain-containing protein n=1 Tax=Streptomyces sp. NPDC021020 TaxID=3365109 RepID=UPI00378B160E
MTTNRYFSVRGWRPALGTALACAGLLAAAPTALAAPGARDIGVPRTAPHPPAHAAAAHASRLPAPRTSAAPAGGTRSTRQGGSLLLDETFTGTSVADPGFQPLDTTCLTGATTAPPAGGSTTGPCTGDDQTTPPVPTPGVTPGYLQLTDNGNYRVGGIVYNRPLPGNGGLEVQFDQYQYGGNGADGIGFFLVDGAHDLTSAGATGGSLGYAQRNLEPGVDGGYLGVGLDAYGNFVNDGEQRGLGCQAPEVSPVPPEDQVPDTVTLRGPGQDLDGYCFLTSTITSDATQPSGYITTLPGSLRGPGSTPDDAQRTVRISVSPDAKPLVTVEIDFHDGNGFRTVLTHQMTETAPPTYKLGFSGSTGGLDDTHLIRNFTASSEVPVDQLNLVKTTAYPPGTDPGTLHAGDTVPYQFLVTNTGPTTLTGVTVTDPDVTDISCPSDTLGPMGTPTSSMVCTGSHTLTDEDVAGKTEFTNTATAHATGSAGEDVDSNPSSATVPVEGPAQPGLDLAKTADATSAEPGQKVTYTLTVTNTGTTPLTAAQVTDDLGDVLDDATYNGDAAATTGTATVTGSTLTWTGDLAPGASATITYSVTVTGDGYDHPAGNGSLTNSATTTTPGATCSSNPSGALPCTVTIPVACEPAPTPPPTTYGTRRS